MDIGAEILGLLLAGAQNDKPARARLVPAREDIERQRAARPLRAIVLGGINLRAINPAGFRFRIVDRHPVLHRSQSPRNPARLSRASGQTPAAELRLPAAKRAGLSSQPEPPAGDPGAVGHRLQLGPDDVLGDPPHAGRGVEAAIGAGHHAMRVADRARDVFEPVGDDLGMLDKPGQIVDDAGDDDLVVGQREFLQDAPFVLVPRVRERQHEAADLGLFQ